jgi:hypothetical protein
MICFGRCNAKCLFPTPLVVDSSERGLERNRRRKQSLTGFRLPRYMHTGQIHAEVDWESLDNHLYTQKGRGNMHVSRLADVPLVVTPI